MAFSPRQQEYLDNATHRWNIKTGATASGKTFLDYAYVIPRRIENCTGEGLIVLIGNNINSIERNVLAPMREIWPGLVSPIRQGNNTVQIFGKRCFVMGADKANQVARIQGATIEYAYGDEVTTWNREFFEMLKSRLRAPNSCFDGTCNPDSPSHWFRKFLDSKADIYQQAYQLDDNKNFLPPATVKNIKLEYSGTIYYDRYVLGKWVRAEGLIYPNLPQAVVATENRRYTQYQIAGDYGIHNPTCFGLLGFHDGTWYLVKEYYHSGRETNHPKTDEEYYNDLVDFAGTHVITQIVIDPSASSFITLIQRRGRFSVRAADNAVLEGIRNTSMALNNGHLKINDCCVKTIEEGGSYSWDEKAGVDKPVKEADHAMDMLRYFVNSNQRRMLPLGKLHNSR